MTARLSAAIITRNERANLPRALRSLAGLADEVVVLDGGSTDGTPTLARALGARVRERAFDGFASQKNACLDLCTGEFILVLDADEAVTPALAAEIRRRVEAPDADAWAVARRSLFLGRFMDHTGWFPDYTVRLLRRGRGRFAPALVHESLAVDGRVARLPPSAHLEHFTTESLPAYLAKLNRYTSLAARDLAARDRRKPTAAELLLLPLFAFLKFFILRRGFRDGREGFLLSALSAYYVFAKYLKLRRLRAGGEGA